MARTFAKTGSKAAARGATIVVSALHARANFGNLLRRVDDQRESLVIAKRGTPKAVLISIRDYLKLAAPEPKVLRLIGEEADRNGTSKLTSLQIQRIIKDTRASRRARVKKTA
jgi:prevent-host-death family protein